MIRLECPQCGGEISYNLFPDGDGDGVWSRSFWNWEREDGGCDCALTYEQEETLDAVIQARIEKGDVAWYGDE